MSQVSLNLMVLDAVTVCCNWNCFYLLVQKHLVLSSGFWHMRSWECLRHVWCCVKPSVSQSSSSFTFSLVRFSCSWWFSTPGVLCPGLVLLGWLAVLWLPWRCRVLEEQHTLDDSVFALDSWFLCRIFYLLRGWCPDVSLRWFLFCLCKCTCFSSAVQIGCVFFVAVHTFTLAYIYFSIKSPSFDQQNGAVCSGPVRRHLLHSWFCRCRSWDNGCHFKMVLQPSWCPNYTHNSHTDWHSAVEKSAYIFTKSCVCWQSNFFFLVLKPHLTVSLKKKKKLAAILFLFHRLLQNSETEIVRFSSSLDVKM